MEEGAERRQAVKAVISHVSSRLKRQRVCRPGLESTGFISQA